MSNPSRSERTADRALMGALAILGVSVAAGCGDLSREARLSSDCDHAIVVTMEQIPESLIGASYSEEVARQQSDHFTLGANGTISRGLAPTGDGAMMSVILGETTTLAVYWGEEVTGSLDYTISGDECLTPPEE